MPEKLKLALSSDTPWQTIKRHDGASQRTRNFNERIPLKSIPGSITVQLRRSPSNVTERELGAAYLEASDLLRDRAKDLLNS